MRYCMNCGNELGNTKFCAKCGTKAPNDEPSNNGTLKKRFCSNCGAEIGDEQYCINCGAKTHDRVFISQTVPVQSVSGKKPVGIIAAVLSLICIICCIVIGAFVFSALYTGHETDSTEYDPYTFDYQSDVFQSGLARVYKVVNGDFKYGFIKEDGSIAIPCLYDDTSNDIYDDYYIAVQLDGKWGLIDDRNNLLIKCEYDSIYYDEANLEFVFSNNGTTTRKSISEIIELELEYLK